MFTFFPSLPSLFLLSVWSRRKLRIKPLVPSILGTERKTDKLRVIKAINRRKCSWTAPLFTSFPLCEEGKDWFPLIDPIKVSRVIYSMVDWMFPKNLESRCSQRAEWREEQEFCYKIRSQYEEEMEVVKNQIRISPCDNNVCLPISPKQFCLSSDRASVCGLIIRLWFFSVVFTHSPSSLIVLYHLWLPFRLIPCLGYKYFISGFFS